MNVYKLILDSRISRLERSSIILINNEEKISDTVYLYNKSNNTYLQIYYINNEFKIYKEHNQLPVNKLLITDYSTVLLNRLKESKN